MLEIKEIEKRGISGLKLQCTWNCAVRKGLVTKKQAVKGTQNLILRRKANSGKQGQAPFCFAKREPVPVFRIPVFQN